MRLRGAVCSTVIRPGARRGLHRWLVRTAVRPCRPRVRGRCRRSRRAVRHRRPGRRRARPPRGARLFPVEVAQGHDGPQVGQVDAVGVAVMDVPRQRAEALPEAGGSAGPAAHAAARADRFAVARLEIGATHAPVHHRAAPCFGHHIPANPAGVSQTGRRPGAKRTMIAAQEDKSERSAVEAAQVEGSPWTVASRPRIEPPAPRGVRAYIPSEVIIGIGCSSGRVSQGIAWGKARIRTPRTRRTVALA
jgi:hypothetical protein